MFQLKSCCKSFGVIQGGHLKAGGVLKHTHIWTKGIRNRQAGCDNEGTARDKRGVSGRSSCLEAED